MYTGLYDCLKNTTLDAYIVSDTKGNIVDANAAATAMYGYSRDELLHLRISDIELQDNIADIQRRSAKLIECGYDRFVSRHCHKDGSAIEVEVSVSFVPGAQSYLAFHRDITGYKHVEEQLSTSEENYRQFTELTSDYVHKCSRVGSAPFRIQWMGGAVGSICGYTQDEIIEKGCWLPFVHPDDRQKVSTHLFSLHPGDFKQIEFRFITKSGAIRLVSEKSRCVAGEQEGELILFGAITDISEQKEAEKALQASKDLLAEIIEKSPISMAIVSMDGTIEQINRRAIETFGYSPDDIPNMERWWMQAYPDEAYRAEVLAQWMGLVGKAITEKCDIERREYRVTCKDGTVKTTLIFGVLVLGKVFVIFDDLTERISVEEDRIHLQKQLLYAQKMESLGILAGGIAHDFNNILMAIVGNADLAKMRLPPESPAYDNILKIDVAAYRAADLAKQMLAYSGRGRFVNETIDLNKLINEMVGMLKVSISKKVMLQCTLAEQLPLVEVDATQIHQVLMNLVINASEAIGDTEGVIVISTGSLQWDGQYLHGIRPMDELKNGLYVCLEVKDSGCGMSREVIEKLFDPFFTTKFTGRGLGMAAVIGILRGHKGSITVESDEGKGTIFKVLLPAVPTCH